MSPQKAFWLLRETLYVNWIIEIPGSSQNSSMFDVVAPEKEGIARAVMPLFLFPT